MMGILAKRTLSDCLLFTIVFFLGFLVVGLPSLILQRLLIYRIPYTYIPHLVFYIFPECFQMLLPSSLVTGVIITFARMGAEKEIMILKASGIQPVRLVYPLLALSFILSFGAWYINDISAICRESGIRSVLLNGSENIVLSMLKSNGEINTRQLRLKANRIDNGILYGVSIHYTESPTSTPIDAEAQMVQISADKEQRMFILDLTKCYFRSGVLKGILREKERVHVSIDAFLPSDAASHITNAPMMKMIKEFSVLNSNIKAAQESIAGDTAMILLSGEYELFNSDEFKKNRANLKDYLNTYKKAIIEPYRRFTMGFACFCLVAISGPLSIYYIKYNIYINVLLSAISSIGLFLFLFVVGLNLGKQGVIPPWMICFADIIPLVIGLFLMKYVANK